MREKTACLCAWERAGGGGGGGELIEQAGVPSNAPAEGMPLASSTLRGPSMGTGKRQNT